MLHTVSVLGRGKADLTMDLKIWRNTKEWQSVNNRFVLKSISQHHHDQGQTEVISCPKEAKEMQQMHVGMILNKGFDFVFGPSYLAYYWDLEDFEQTRRLEDWCQSLDLEDCNLAM